MKILFILGESGSGKTTLEKHLIENYGFKSIDKLSSRPHRDGDESGYTYFSAQEIVDMWVDWLVQECVKYDGHFYAMRLTHDAKKDDCYVATVVPAGYHQFIDMGIEDNNEVYSIFLTCDIAEQWMRQRWDSEESIKSRMKLNKRLRRSWCEHNQYEWSRGTEPVVELMKLIYPSLFYGQQNRDSEECPQV